MTKLDYLKLAIANQLYQNKAWIVSAFALTKQDNVKPIAFHLYHDITGHYYYDDQLNKVKISDAKVNEPLFNFLDIITVDKTLCSNVREPVETKLGNLLFNLICMVYAFKDKIPFVTGKVSVGKIEAIIAPILVDDGKGIDGKIEVSSYKKWIDSLRYLESIADICVVSATEKNIQLAPGFEVFKKNLIKEYEGRLNDPVVFSEFEKKLQGFDDEYLSDDPSTRAFMSGKVRNIARTKMFLTMGAQDTFNTELSPKPVLNSLHEGIPTDAEDFKNLMNGTRSGIFSRAAETQQGGVTAKYMLRAANTFKIDKEDCGTTNGIHRQYSKDNISNLVGRYIVSNGKTTLIENLEQANNYLDKSIYVRSPMYCKSVGNSLCKICAGKRLSQLPTGLSIPLTDISSTIITISLKAMHGRVLSTAKVIPKELFS